MPTPLDDAIASAHDGVPDCLAVGLIDMTTGLLLGSKTAEPCSPELVDLVAAATGELFQGPNVTAIEMLFRKERAPGRGRRALLLGSHHHVAAGGARLSALQAQP